MNPTPRQGEQHAENGLVDTHERLLRRLACDLHDGPAQSLAAALLHLDMLERMVPDKLETIHEIKTALENAIEEIRALVGYYRPRACEPDGLIPKLRFLIEDCRASGLDATLLVEGDEPELSVSAQIALLRLVQEALTNTRQHASASGVVVSLSFTPDETRCTIEDDGDGLPTNDPDNWSPPQTCYGIWSMRERTALLGGELQIANTARGGVRVTARIPLWQ